MTVETTGTTGTPTRVAFSGYELDVIRALSTIAFLMAGQIAAEDVVVIATSPRAIGSIGLAASATRIGANVRTLGAQEPATMLEVLSDPPAATPGHVSRPKRAQREPVLSRNAVEAGAESEMGPGDLGLRRILTGGEPRHHWVERPTPGPVRRRRDRRRHTR